MSASTPTAAQQTAPGAGGPPVPPVKPVLSSPGAYMANFQSGSAGSTVPPITAGIHGTNKTHEKPTIAARPIPPPKLPNYSSSFNKIDRDRNEFTKIDKAEREKVSLLATKREMFFKSESNSPSGPPPNPPVGLNSLNLANNNVIHNNSANAATTDKHSTAAAGLTNSAGATNNSSPAAVSIGAMVTNNNHNGLNGSVTTNGSGLAGNNNLASVGGVNGLTTSMNSVSLKEKRDALLNHHDGGANGHHHHHHADAASAKLANERHEKEKPVVKSKPKELDGYVGFANLPNQVYRKAVKKGFELTLMVVGESGLGKSTLINSMFLSDIYHAEQHPGPSKRIKKTVAVESTKVLLKENGVNLTLTVVDTPGFGDAVDNSNCWLPIVDFVESKYEEYLTAESRVHRTALPDSRVHVCLYFIAPSGHGLKPLDIEFMQRLCDKVNIIPVIAKADTLTPEEITLFKKQILNEIAQHKIKIYDFPDPMDEEEDAKVLRQLRSRVPFAVVGANAIIEIDGRKVRGRRYPWGVAEVENLDHCDFIALRNMVIRTNLQDLKDVTNNVHYENYRCRKLAGLGTDGKAKLSNNLCNIGTVNTNGTGWNPLAQMEEEKREHESKMKKMEAEMEQVFEMKVKEKKQKLKDSEAELTRRHEERKKALELQIRELEDRRKAFEQEKSEWEQQNGVTLDELRRKSLEANSKETASLASRSSDESKGRRVFGSLLRRHTSFGAPDAVRGVTGAAGSTSTLTTSANNNSSTVPPSPQDHNES
ncbi:septin-7 isoform X1 [Anopheles stephensi]|uniref:septin-7 isoform X1 n=3 Tax=Anopheles stephensi TaxID=30069 RepID=UPI001658C3A2|nr:septin-7 isoform X1 [Anopheles stephensi]XP_035911857.1 septin-7 isoform X1 [Anopheles stephensi]XP_035911858.1 septin-7 isoform X1 [Anopheles stephensi]XP_035911859.1 septin-7 isoform X1 [Anopheles stephensi]XP_035911860.1 septin-7 isoform X1 [Anopheles stephensi]XP_035911861.1 septin-7 isoform X1 [Anopheles stephensi]XP_035911862.1 septin-7 isoform X1 [Anopheles stephensi]XP_035911863.1 septin-7 isoform X1 [Anopheles stephensi]XP_035911865.1 septin-7 isoform X1 [Anopheles stephensi]XP